MGEQKHGKRKIDFVAMMMMIVVVDFNGNFCDHFGHLCLIFEMRATHYDDIESPLGPDVARLTPGYGSQSYGGPPSPAATLFMMDDDYILDSPSNPNGGDGGESGARTTNLGSSGDSSSVSPSTLSGRKRSHSTLGTSGPGNGAYGLAGEKGTAMHGARKRLLFPSPRQSGGESAGIVDFKSIASAEKRRGHPLISPTGRQGGSHPKIGIYSITSPVYADASTLSGSRSNSNSTSNSTSNKSTNSSSSSGSKSKSKSRKALGEITNSSTPSNSNSTPSTRLEGSSPITPGTRKRSALTSAVAEFDPSLSQSLSMSERESRSARTVPDEIVDGEDACAVRTSSVSARTALKDLGLSFSPVVEKEEAAPCSVPRSTTTATKTHTEPSVPDVKIKMAVVGDSGVGKTTMLLTGVKGESLIGSYAPTVGVDFVKKPVRVAAPGGGETSSICALLEMYDSAGQERFASLTRSFYRGAHIGVLVFDASCLDSLHRLSYWREQVLVGIGATSIVDTSFPFVLVATKTDLLTSEEAKEAVRAEAAAWIRFHGGSEITYLECTATDVTSIDHVFGQAASVALASSPSLSSQHRAVTSLSTASFSSSAPSSSSVSASPRRVYDGRGGVRFISNTGGSVNGHPVHLKGTRPTSDRRGGKCKC